MKEINYLEIALTTGIIWSSVILITGLTAAHYSWKPALKFVNFISGVYRGYEPNLKGSLIGLIWGFIDGILTGLFIAFLCSLVL